MEPAVCECFGILFSAAGPRHRGVRRKNLTDGPGRPTTREHGGGARVVDRHATAQAGTAVERDGADALFIEVQQIGFVIHPGVQGLPQGWQLAACDDNNRAVNFGDHADRYGFSLCKRCIGQRENSSCVSLFR